MPVRSGLLGSLFGGGDSQKRGTFRGRVAFALLAPTAAFSQPQAQKHPDVLDVFNNAQHGFGYYNSITGKIVSGGDTINANNKVHDGLADITSRSAAVVSANTNFQEHAEGVVASGSALRSAYTSLSGLGSPIAIQQNYLDAYSAFNTFMASADNSNRTEAVRLGARLKTAIDALTGGAEAAQNQADNLIAANNNISTARAHSQNAANNLVTLRANEASAYAALNMYAASANAFRDLTLYTGLNHANGTFTPGIAPYETAAKQNNAIFLTGGFVGAYGMAQSAEGNAITDAIKNAVVSAAKADNTGIAQASHAFENRLHNISRARFAVNRTSNDAFKIALNSVAAKAVAYFRAKAGASAALTPEEIALNTALAAYNASGDAMNRASVQAAFSNAAKVLAGVSDASHAAETGELRNAIEGLYHIELAAAAAGITSDSDFTQSEHALTSALNNLSFALAFSGSRTARNHAAALRSVRDSLTPAIVQGALTSAAFSTFNAAHGITANAANTAFSHIYFWQDGITDADLQPDRLLARRQSLAGEVMTATAAVDTSQSDVTAKTQANTAASAAVAAKTSANASAFAANTSALSAWTTADTANASAYAANTAAWIPWNTANTANATAYATNTSALSAWTTANTANASATTANSQALSAWTTANTANASAYAANTAAWTPWNTANTAAATANATRQSRQTNLNSHVTSLVSSSSNAEAMRAAIFREQTPEVISSSLVLRNYLTAFNQFNDFLSSSDNRNYEAAARYANNLHSAATDSIIWGSLYSADRQAVRNSVNNLIDSRTNYNTAVTAAGTANSTRDTAAATLSTARTALSTTQSTLTTRTTELATARSALSTAKSTLTTRASELSTARSTLATAQSTLATRASALASTRSALATSQSTLTTRTTALASARSALATAQSELATAESDLSSAQTALGAAQSQLASARQELSQAQASLADFIASSQAVIDSLPKYKMSVPLYVLQARIAATTQVLRADIEVRRAALDMAAAKVREAAGALQSATSARDSALNAVVNHVLGLDATGQTPYRSFIDTIQNSASTSAQVAAAKAALAEQVSTRTASDSSTQLAGLSQAYQTAKTGYDDAQRANESAVSAHTAAVNALAAARRKHDDYVADTDYFVRVETNTARPGLGDLSRALRLADEDMDGATDHDRPIAILDVSLDLHSRTLAAAMTIDAYIQRVDALNAAITANKAVIERNTAAIALQSRRIAGLQDRAGDAAEGIAAAYALAGVPQLPDRLNLTISAGEFDGQEAVGFTFHGQIGSKVAFSSAVVRSGDKNGLAFGLTLGL